MRQFRRVEDRPVPPAEVVLRNAHIITVDGLDTIAQAIAIADGKILAVGAAADVAKHLVPPTRRAGITRDTVAPVPSVKIEKDGNGDPTGVFFEDEYAPLVELIWFRDAASFTAADRLRTLPESAKAYHSFGTTSIFEGHGVANEL